MVMPCSRSARRPSVSSEKSISPPRRAGLELIFVRALGVVQQAPDQRGLAVVHAAGRGQAQQVLRLLRGQELFDVERSLGCLLQEAAAIQKYPSRFFNSMEPSRS